MFLDNKYTKWYYQIIENARNRELDGYGENHHIIPRSLGGCDDFENMVKLTAREHYVAHMLLVKMLEGNPAYKMAWAFHRMVFSRVKRKDLMDLTSRQYETARKIHSNNMRKFHPSQHQEWRDAVSKRVQSEWDNDPERKAKMSEWAKAYHKEQRESDPNYLARLREIGLKGARAAAKVNGKKVEYKGTTYESWPDLLKKTGVSKHLYKKYYLNGIDPEFRIGADGPIKKDSK